MSRAVRAETRSRAKEEIKRVINAVDRVRKCNQFNLSKLRKGHYVTVANQEKMKVEDPQNPALPKKEIVIQTQTHKTPSRKRRDRERAEKHSKENDSRQTPTGDDSNTQLSLLSQDESTQHSQASSCSMDQPSMVNEDSVISFGEGLDENAQLSTLSQNDTTQNDVKMPLTFSGQAPHERKESGSDESKDPEPPVLEPAVDPPTKKPKPEEEQSAS